MHRRKLFFRPSRAKIKKIREIESSLVDYTYNPELAPSRNLQLFGNLLLSPARVNVCDRVPSLVDDLE